jgi:uncharacterized protein YdeI (BOF family)
MKKSLLVIALAAATMPLTFAKQAAGQAPAANPPAVTTDSHGKTTVKTKKHVKKAKKAPKTEMPAVSK